MATLQGKWLGQRGVALKGAFYVRTWRGKLVVAKWPRGKAGKIDAGTRQRMADFKHAQKLAQYVIPQQQIVAREVTAGTALLPRDLLTAGMYGRLWAFTTEDGRTLYSEAARSDVSKNLEILGPLEQAAVPQAPPAIASLSEDAMPRLTKSGSLLALDPLNGNLLPIDGTNETVPSAGVVLAATGLTPATDYRIYAFMNGATMTLEASTTGHETDPATGVEVKVGDTSRTLVGMARPIVGPAWQDAPAQRFVISWFNRRNITGQKFDNTLTLWTSVPVVELSTLYRVEFLNWADDMPVVHLSNYIWMTVLLGAWAGVEAAVDTVAITMNVKTFAKALNEWVPVGLCGMPLSLTEGYHFSTMQGLMAAGVTGNSQRFANSTLIRG